MNSFLEWFGPTLALSIGVMILAVFFNVLAAVKRAISPVKKITIKGFLKDHDRVTLQMKRDEAMEDVRIVGFLDATSAKGVLPYQLANMMVVETRSGERILLRAEDVRSIRQLKSDGNE